MKKNITDKKIIRALALILSISVFITGCGMTDLYDKLSGKGKADDKKEEIGDQEDGAAVLAGDEGEAPDVAESDCASGGEEEEAEAACEVFTCVVVHVRFLVQS